MRPKGPGRISFTPCGCPCLPTAGQRGGPEHSLKCFPNGTTTEGRRRSHWLFSECQPHGWFLRSSFSLHVRAPSWVCAYEGEHTQMAYTSVMYTLQFMCTELPRALQQNQRPAHNLVRKVVAGDDSPSVSPRATITVTKHPGRPGRLSVCLYTCQALPCKPAVLRARPQRRWGVAGGHCFCPASGRHGGADTGV